MAAQLQVLYLGGIVRVPSARGTLMRNWTERTSSERVWYLGDM